MESGFGVVLFDDPITHDSAWSCVHGFMPERISTTGELPSNIVWLTNLAYDAARVSGLNGSRFRRSEYLGHDLSRIWSELGLSDDFMVDLRTVWGGRYNHVMMLRAAFSAWIFRQTVLAAAQVIPLQSPPARDIMRGLHEHVIPLAAKYFYRGLPVSDVLVALTMADQSWQPAARDRPIDMSATQMRVYPHRVTHAISMLAQPYPVSSQWNEVNLKDIGDIAEWISENTLSLFRVTVVRTHSPDMERLVNYGANIQNRKSEDKGKWLTGLDVMRIMPYCDIKIHRIMQSTESITGFDWLERSGVAIDPDALAIRAGAYSFHLFMDALWRAIMRPPVDFKARDVSIPSATFIRSRDRQVLFNHAINLHEMGLYVTGYGSGGITFEVGAGVKKDVLARTIVQAGLFPPFCAPGVFEADDAMNIAMLHQNHRLPEAARRLEAAFLMGDLQTIIDMDEALFDWSP